METARWHCIQMSQKRNLAFALPHAPTENLVILVVTFPVEWFWNVVLNSVSLDEGIDPGCEFSWIVPMFLRTWFSLLPSALRHVSIITIWSISDNQGRLFALMRGSPDTTIAASGYQSPVDNPIKGFLTLDF